MHRKPSKQSADLALCQYTYKPCSHPRSTKRNGALHLLCEFHRTKANRIQQAYAAKKRLRQMEAFAPASPTSTDTTWQAVPELTFSPDDLRAIEAMTFAEPSDHAAVLESVFRDFLSDPLDCYSL
ncbi:hypothetical protein SPRG_15439 [Saprolegnia parasitica CBS 223.65]|uniref:Uncharacterized protein n=1 Tax=Saprolegnia parasitica (strain CBS 223.65) TaxID=695850 RepID=A0A067BKC6_SAPPC|nr:hypothetical protein SPRG_15439 [Saprolegnia parasitica CBS 223.65]KDO18643.1 hypothetical protein SPRG_15439 [Saprolegnia parasitica CBS 223.65]|eukprot:XP_012210648.1 hypothetical protein SPRG_15439 [Saprolegnia parasitica CBS 223.65]